MVLVRLKRLFLSPPIADWESIRRHRPARRAGVLCETGTEEGVILSAPLSNRTGGLGFLARSMRKECSKQYELEAIGASVWHAIDGRKNLESLCGLLQRKFGLNQLEAQTSLVEFMRSLEARGLIEVRGGKP